MSSAADTFSEPEMQTALDRLCAQIETPGEANALRALLPRLRTIMASEYISGVKDGRTEGDKP